MALIVDIQRAKLPLFFLYSFTQSMHLKECWLESGAKMRGYLGRLCVEQGRGRRRLMIRDMSASQKGLPAVAADILLAF